MQPMANDRLMVRCKACRETYTLAKYWGGGEFQHAAALSVEGQRQRAEPLVGRLFGDAQPVQIWRSKWRAGE